MKLKFANKSTSSSPAIRADVHLHTRHSHGRNTTREMFDAARAKGLTIIGFSEHSPRPEGYSYAGDYQEKLAREFPLYVQEVRELTGQGSPEGVEVLLGLELDYIPAALEYARKLVREYPYDYVLGGLHFQDAWGFDSRAEDWTKFSRDELFAIYARYYQDLESMCRSGLFHIAAHPDLIKIFTADSFNEWLKTGEAWPFIRAALKALKEAGMAMEVSSAGLRKPCKEIYPGPAIMEEAVALGLPISFASDAHCVNTPAYAFDQLARYAASFGYTESVIFRQGRAEALPFSIPASLETV